MGKIRLNRVDVMSTALCVMLIIPAVSIYDKLPDRMVTQFGINGQPQHYAQKNFVVFGIPLLMAAIQLILCLITNLFSQAETSDRINKAIRFANPASYYLAYLSLLLHALGQMKDPVSVICTFMAVAFVVLGNYMPKIRRNMFLGVRTPRTLANQEVWDKVQRFMGITTIICGIVILPFALMKKYVPVFVMMILRMIATFIYSEMIHRSEKDDIHE